MDRVRKWPRNQSTSQGGGLSRPFHILCKPPKDVK